MAGSPVYLLTASWKLLIKQRLCGYHGCVGVGRLFGFFCILFHQSILGVCPNQFSDEVIYVSFLSPWRKSVLPRGFPPLQSESMMIYRANNVEDFQFYELALSKPATLSAQRFLRSFTSG